MVRALDLPGNPSSVHAEGREARAAIEAARDQVARFVGAKAKNVIFTSGGTEASDGAKPDLSAVLAARAARTDPCATEHPCGPERAPVPGGRG